VSHFIGCVLVAPSGECSRGEAGYVRRVWQQFSRSLTILYIVPPCVAMLIARYVVN